MSSLKRILASRANGARSRGPATIEGKQRSSQNALAHALLARCTLMQGESPEALEALFKQHVERLGPCDGVELGMVQEMVAAYWRLRRAWAIETRLLDNQVAAQDPGDEWTAWLRLSPILPPNPPPPIPNEPSLPITTVEKKL